MSVIIPSFNRAHVLERAIDSVLAQTFKRFEVLVVDDGSTDNTSDLLKKYSGNSLVHVLSQENKGVSSARNTGAKASRAEWIAFLDSDDEWLPGKLEKQFRFIKANPTIEFLHTEELWIRNGVRVNPKVKHRKHGDDLFERSLEFCLISPSTVLMKKSLFDKYGPFNESFVVCEDFDLWNRILAREEVGYIEEAMVRKYGGHDDQLSTKFVAMDYWRIKSLVSLYQLEGMSDKKKNLIKNTITKKAAILLKGYVKHQNKLHFDEINSLLAQINIS